MNTSRVSPRPASAVFVAAFAVLAASGADNPSASNAPAKSPTLAVEHGKSDLAHYHGVKVTALSGTTVSDLEAKPLGEIHDVIVDPASGKIRYAVLSFGGTMGVGDDYYAIPMRDLRLSPDGKEHLVAASLTKEKLAKAKHFAKDAWPSDKRFWDDADKIYGISPTPAMAGLTALRLHDFVGAEIHDKSGAAIGTVQDLVVDMNDQSVHYVVVKSGPELGGKLIAVPITAFDLAQEAKKPVLDLDRTKALTLAQYEQWPDVNDTTAVRSIERGWDQAFPKRGSVTKREG